MRADIHGSPTEWMRARAGSLPARLAPADAIPCRDCASSTFTRPDEGATVWRCERGPFATRALATCNHAHATCTLAGARGAADLNEVRNG
jgi:hypothetical protein